MIPRLPESVELLDLTDETDGLLQTLTDTLPWRQESVRMFGRSIPQPRLTCWCGDPGALYTYSGVAYVPEPWPDALAGLLPRLQDLTGAPYNSVLCNLYRDGKDSMGWHSDDEPELGPTPTIASLSLGATRTFRMKHRSLDLSPVSIELEHGSLLVMRGDTQTQWQHCVPRRLRVHTPRINLTFRHILG